MSNVIYRSVVKNKNIRRKRALFDYDYIKRHHPSTNKKHVTTITPSHHHKATTFDTHTSFILPFLYKIVQLSAPYYL